MNSDNTGPRPTPSTFSQLLKRLRTAADLTQEALAERADVSTRLVSDLERGVIYRPRRDTVRLLADGLGLTGSDRERFVSVARRRADDGEPAASDGAPSGRVSLPLPLSDSPIIGREREVAATTSLLLRPEVRLLTLTGPGGVGKTRLALDVAARASHAFADGAYFVDLAPVRDPTLVLPTIAGAVGLKAAGDRPLRERLVGFLADRRLLLVLDNVEHLPNTAAVVADLLAACPGPAVLATSRARLHIRVEHEYAIAPLALPDLRRLPPPDELARIPAVALFVQRAEAANRGFALTAGNAGAVAEIAVRLDGLPLAIELAAARVKILPPAALLARLGRRLPLLTGGALDQPTRLQTMRDAIAWSYDLLSDEEQRLFRRLSVFAGGVTLEGAEGTAPPPPPDSPSVLDSLTALVDQSLLQVLDDGSDAPRFRMLETIREYGLDRLAATGEEAAVRDRHAAWYLALAERASPELTGADQARWFDRLEVEHDNLRAALGWAVERCDAELTLRLGGALYRFWITGGYLDEGRRWLERALALETPAPPAARAEALLGAGVLAYFQGDYAQATAHGEAAQALFLALDDRRGVASSFGNLGLVADAQGDYQQATERYEEALQCFRALGDQIHTNFMLGNLGLIAYFLGEYERAWSLLDDAVALARARGDRNSVAISLGNLGLVAYAQGDYERAAALQREALGLRRVLGNKSHLARIFENVALIAASTQQPARAARLFGAAEALRARIGAPLQPNDREFNEPRIAAAREDLGESAFAAAWDEGTAMSIEEAIDYVLGDDPELFAGALRPTRVDG